MALSGALTAMGVAAIGAQARLQGVPALLAAIAIFAALAAEDLLLLGTNTDTVSARIAEKFPDMARDVRQFAQSITAAIDSIQAHILGFLLATQGLQRFAAPFARMAGLDDGPSGSGQVDANGDPIWIQRDDEGNRIGDSSDDELQRLRGLYLRMVDPELHARARLQYLLDQQPPPSPPTPPRRATTSRPSASLCRRRRCAYMS